MGLEFGHHLGLVSALSGGGLAFAPLVPAYGELVARQRALGFRHLGDALAGDGKPVRVLDGLYVPGVPRGWQRVDTEVIRRVRPVTAADPGPFVQQLISLHARDSGALRRVLLYQLTALLQQDVHERASKDDVAAAEALGVDAGEARALAHVARTSFRLNAAQRAAAEELEDAWKRRQLGRAHALAAALPTPDGRDALLADRVRRASEGVADVKRLLGRARSLERTGEVEAARGHYLDAVRTTRDSPAALSGLVRTSLSSESETAPAPVRALSDASAVHLVWDEVEPASSWLVLRVEPGPGRSDRITEVCEVADVREAYDRSPSFGATVRYAVLPLHDGLAAGPVLVSPPVLLAPEIDRLRVTDGPGRLTARWTMPRQAVGTTVCLTGPAGPVDLQVRDDGFTVHGLPPGEYRLRVQCRYRSPADMTVVSTGVAVRATLPSWPEPVRTLTAHPADGSVAFSWAGGQDAEVRLVPWPPDEPGPPAAGTETVETSVTVLSALPWRRTGENTYLPPPGTSTVVTAVALRENRAVFGPSTRVVAPCPVTGLRADRTGGGLVRITFDWPDGAGQVCVVLKQGETREERLVTRSTFLREGLRLAVGPGAALLSATPTVHDPTDEAVLVLPEPAITRLRPDVTVSYRIVPGARRPLRRRPPTVFVQLSGPVNELDHEIPEFVLVARSAGSGTSSRHAARPAGPSDGTVVLRLSGSSLCRPDAVAYELAPHDCRPPYTLRGFLLGGTSDSVRLQDPPPTTLVMR